MKNRGLRQKNCPIEIISFKSSAKQEGERPDISMDMGRSGLSVRGAWLELFALLRKFEVRRKIGLFSSGNGYTGWSGVAFGL